MGQVADSERGVQTSAVRYHHLLRNRPVKHAGTEAAGVIVAGENVVVDAAFTSFPECRVGCQFVECHRHVAQLSVDFHDCRPGGEAENLGIGKPASGYLECLFLNGFRQSFPPEFRLYDQSRIGHEFLVVPALDVAESRKYVGLHRNDGLPLANFLFNVFRFPLGDAGAPHLRCIFDCLQNFRDVGNVLFSSNFNDEIFHRPFHYYRSYGVFLFVFYRKFQLICINIHCMHKYTHNYPNRKGDC